METTRDEYEDESLAQYALKNTRNEGRIHKEDPDPYRTSFQRDRDRIIHSKAFRRLAYKTQVFFNLKGDNFRTRLTHSLEVSQLSRTVAGVLRLNKDYVEALSLAHDLGHTPFGHSGQDSLNKKMMNKGGFEHNKQNLRIVTVLEDQLPYCEGLNLTRALLKGLMKHGEIYEDDEPFLQELKQEKEKKSPPLEFYLVDLCDRIAYIHHDIEDGINAGFLHFDEVLALDYWKKVYEELYKTWKYTFPEARPTFQIRMMIRHSLNAFIKDVIETSKNNLERLNLQSLDDVYLLPEKDNPVKNSEEYNEHAKKILDFLRSKLYKHPRVENVSRRGEKLISFLFDFYKEHFHLLPLHFQKRKERFSEERIIADYISGMTDRFIVKNYKLMKAYRKVESLLKTPDK